MYYSEELVEEVKESCNIVDLISGYVSLKKKGTNYFGLCPFHNEKSPSFSVNEERQMFHCFGCGVSGNVYTFLMKYENYTFPEAVQQLAARSGITLPEVSDDGREAKKDNRKKLLFDVNREAAKYFYYSLKDRRGAAGLEYFRKRCLSDETIQHFGLGFAVKDSGQLIAYLRSKGFDDEIIMESGIADHRERTGLTCKFWNRVMFPIQDIGGKVIGFGGRVMGEGEPKYLNSPETDIFIKRKNLYGLNYARTSRKDHLILCEGYMDVIAMHQAGFTQAVASLGTAFTDQQALLIKRYAKNVILSYDSDGPGIKAALKAIGILRNAGLFPRVLHLEPYKDPDEYIKNLGPEKFEERLREAENGFYFEVGVLEQGSDLRDPDGRTAFHNGIARKLSGISDSIQRENYLTAIAEKYQINPVVLRDAVRAFAASGITDRDNEAVALTVDGSGAGFPMSRAGRQKKQKEDRERKSAALVLGYIGQQPQLYEKIAPFISPEDFKDPVLKKAAEMIFESAAAGSEIVPASFINHFEDENEQKAVGEIFFAQEDAMYAVDGSGDDEKNAGDKGKVGANVFIDALRLVKSAAWESRADTAPIEELFKYKKDMEAIEKLRIDIPGQK